MECPKYGTQREEYLLIILDFLIRDLIPTFMATAHVAMETDIPTPVPQTVGLPGQTPNSAGGYSWPLSDMGRVRRFLCLGSEGGSYYTNQKQLGNLPLSHFML